MIVGLTTAKFELSNPRKPELKSIDIEALADTGALHFCIPEHIKIQLGLDEVEKRKSFWPRTVNGWFHCWSYPDAFYESHGFCGCFSHGRSGLSWCYSDGRYGFACHPTNTHVNY